VSYELARGNSIVRIDQPAGTKCPLAVNFANPLDLTGYAMKHNVPDGVETFEVKDPHYEIQAGYQCVRSRHVVAGPN
jgi:hypothetical protein